MGKPHLLIPGDELLQYHNNRNTDARQYAIVIAREKDFLVFGHRINGPTARLSHPTWKQVARAIATDGTGFPRGTTTVDTFLDIVRIKFLTK